MGGRSAGRRVGKGVPQHKAAWVTWALAHSLLPSPQPALSPASAPMARPPGTARTRRTAPEVPGEPGLPDQHLRSMRLVVAQAIRRLAGHDETSWEALAAARSGRVPGVFHRHHRALRFWATRSDRHARWLAQCVLGAWARAKRPGDLFAGLDLADALVRRRRAARRAVLAQVPELVWQVLAQTQQLLVPAPRAPMATDSAVGVAALYLRAFSRALCAWAARYALRNPVAMAGTQLLRTSLRGHSHGPAGAAAGPTLWHCAHRQHLAAMHEAGLLGHDSHLLRPGLPSRLDREDVGALDREAGRCAQRSRAACVVATVAREAPRLDRVLRAIGQGLNAPQRRKLTSRYLQALVGPWTVRLAQWTEVLEAAAQTPQDRVALGHVLGVSGSDTEPEGEPGLPSSFVRGARYVVDRYQVARRLVKLARAQGYVVSSSMLDEARPRTNSRLGHRLAAAVAGQNNADAEVGTGIGARPHTQADTGPDPDELETLDEYLLEEPRAPAVQRRRRARPRASLADRTGALAPGDWPARSARA